MDLGRLLRSSWRAKRTVEVNNMNVLSSILQIPAIRTREHVGCDESGGDVVERKRGAFFQRHFAHIRNPHAQYLRGNHTPALCKRYFARPGPPGLGK
ncbi:hypothetical protein Mapa_012290 [Marchantia paleacea]|nr:hypothetical protein Mapa_012290 [Marchantia paleacea]